MQLTVICPIFFVFHTFQYGHLEVAGSRKDWEDRIWNGEWNLALLFDCLIWSFFNLTFSDYSNCRPRF